MLSTGLHLTSESTVLILRPSTSQKTETALLQDRAQAVDREIQKTIKEAR